MKKFLLPLSLIGTILLSACSVSLGPAKASAPEIEGWNALPWGSEENVNPVRGHSLWCDRLSGDLFASNGKVIFVSRDYGATVQEIVERQEKGRHYNSTGFDADWKGHRLALFPVDNPIGWMTLDNGRTWKVLPRPLKYPGKAKHDGWTYGVVDWTDPQPKRIFAKEHHTQNYWFSSDAGENWEIVVKGGGYSGIGFGADGALLIGYAKQKQEEKATMEQGIHRSSDEGKSWELVQKVDLNQKIKPQRWDQTLYWPAKEGILRSKDGGKTWAMIDNTPGNVLYGPYFGETEDDMIVVSAEGVWRSKDQGVSWKLVMKREAFHPNIRDANFNNVMPCFGWDWQNDLLYITSMGVPIFIGPLQ